MINHMERAILRPSVWPCEKCGEEAAFFAVDHTNAANHIYTDDEGHFHRHNPNKQTDVYKCKNSHYTSNPDLWIKACPLESCGYGK